MQLRKSGSLKSEAAYSEELGLRDLVLTQIVFVVGTAGLGGG